MSLAIKHIVSAPKVNNKDKLKKFTDTYAESIQQFHIDSLDDQDYIADFKMKVRKRNAETNEIHNDGEYEEIIED